MAELLDQLEVTAALVSAEAGVAGHIADILYWYEGLANWTHSTPQTRHRRPRTRSSIWRSTGSMTAMRPFRAT